MRGSKSRPGDFAGDPGLRTAAGADRSFGSGSFAGGGDFLSATRIRPVCQPDPAKTYSDHVFMPGITRSPAWSPDNKQLAYTAEVSGVRKVFRKNLESVEER